MQKEDTVVQQSSPVVQQPTPQPTPSVEKYPSNYNKYCTPSSVSFDSTVSNSFLLKIGNPDSLSCKYGVSLYEMDRTKINVESRSCIKWALSL